MRRLAKPVDAVEGVVATVAMGVPLSVGAMTLVSNTHFLGLLMLLIWMPALVVGAGTSMRNRRARVRRERKVAGLCLSCGYDLRATPGRCPECGTSAAASGDAEG